MTPLPWSIALDTNHSCEYMVWCSPPLSLVGMSMIPKIWLDGFVKKKTHNPTSDGGKGEYSTLKQSISHVSLI